LFMLCSLSRDDVEDDSDRYQPMCCNCIQAADLLVNSQGEAGRLQRTDNFSKEYFSPLL